MPQPPEVLAPEQRSQWPIRLIAGIVFLNGLFAFVEVLFTRLSVKLEDLLPIRYVYYGRLFGLFTGFLLIYFSSQLLQRKRLAWWIAMVGSLGLVLLNLFFSRQSSTLILPAASLTLLLLYDNEYWVMSEPTNLQQGLKLLILSLAVALTYGTIGFAKLLPRDFIPAQNITLEQGMVRTVREFTLIGNDDLHPRTRQATWFLTSLDMLGVLSISFAFLSLFRPLAYRYGTLPNERSRARELLDSYGTSSEDAFKLWPEDKSYFFAPGSTGFLAYRVERGVAVVLGEPIGPLSEWPALLRLFKTFCRRHDWIVAFIYVPETHVDTFEEAGFRQLKIGEDAVVEISNFVDEVARNKNFRAIKNKFNRLGYTFEVSRPPHGHATLSATAAVSRSWLQTSGRSERGFGLGYQNWNYLQRSQLYLVYDRSHRVVAFANAIHSYNPNQATIDLMRYRTDTETGTMDFLFLNILQHLAASDVAEFSLGFTPLAGLGSGPERTPEELMLGYLARVGLGRFSYQGLRRFKSKFKPRWEGRYLMYERGLIGLAQTAVAIGEVLKSQDNNDVSA